MPSHVVSRLPLNRHMKWQANKCHGIVLLNHMKYKLSRLPLMFMILWISSRLWTWFWKRWHTFHHFYFSEHGGRSWRYGRKEGNVLFNDALNTFYLQIYCVRHMCLRTILIVRKETRCPHIGYSFRLAARVLLYASFHRQDNTYHSLCYTSLMVWVGSRQSLHHSMWQRKREDPCSVLIPVLLADITS